MNGWMESRLPAMGLFLLGSIIATTAIAATYNISIYLISSGSGEVSSSNYHIRGIIGQSIITPIAVFSTTHRLRAGIIPVNHPGAVSLTTDSDNDGIPDSYEMASGLNPASNDASLDLDNSRVTSSRWL